MTEPRLLYLANNRLPTEKAHGLQIVQMCEALAQAGYRVTLVTPRRRNTPELRGVESLWAHYGVDRNFALRTLPCLDLQMVLPARLTGAAFLIQTFTYVLVLRLWLLFQRAEVLYTRDLFVGGLVALTAPRRTLVYEVHSLHRSRVGGRLQGLLARRSCVVALTGTLAAELRARGARRVRVEHDGVRRERFSALPTPAEARAALHLAPGAFVAGYVGRLHTMTMPKGLDTLVEAVALATRAGTVIDLLVVGGPEEGVTAVRQQWDALGLPPERLHTTGQLPPAAVARALAALDVGVLPLPWTQHFAYYASALKLFEYMMAGCAVVASDLPSTAEVVQDGVSALLVPPGDPAALADALRRLHADPGLRARLAARARREVEQYTWEARAARIRAFVEGEGGCA